MPRPMNKTMHTTGKSHGPMIFRDFIRISSMASTCNHPASLTYVASRECLFHLWLPQDTVTDIRALGLPYAHFCTPPTPQTASIRWLAMARDLRFRDYGGGRFIHRAERLPLPHHSRVGADAEVNGHTIPFCERRHPRFRADAFASFVIADFAVTDPERQWKESQKAIKQK